MLKACIRNSCRPSSGSRLSTGDLPQHFPKHLASPFPRGLATRVVSSKNNEGRPHPNTSLGEWCLALKKHPNIQFLLACVTSGSVTALRTVVARPNKSECPAVAVPGRFPASVVSQAIGFRLLIQSQSSLVTVDHQCCHC